MRKLKASAVIMHIRVSFNHNISIESGHTLVHFGEYMVPVQIFRFQYLLLDTSCTLRIRGGDRDNLRNKLNGVPNPM